MLLAASRLAKAKSPVEVLDIDPKAISKAAGGIPEDHQHCAVLAAQILHLAVDKYMCNYASSDRCL